MLDFQRLDLAKKSMYDRYFRNCGQRGCEYSFPSLYMWGRQKATVIGDYLVICSHVRDTYFYPFPIGTGDVRPVLDAILSDARKRKIHCWITSLTAGEMQLLEQYYPGKFEFIPDRDGYDYVYSIDDLADLRGRKFQKKRNHINRFYENHPNARVLPLTEENREAACRMLIRWYAVHKEMNPQMDFSLEETAIRRGFEAYEQLGMEGIMLEEDGQVLAFSMGCRLNDTTVDVNYEKAVEDADGAYAAINQAFARYIREAHPEVRWLNREDDMGLEGLRKAKLSYNPAYLIEKSRAHLLENCYDL